MTVLVAPLNWFGLQQQQQQQVRRRDEHHCHDSIAMQLVRWLLFRLSFASAVATLYSVTDSSSLLAGIYTDHYVSCRYAPFLFTSASCVRSIAAVVRDVVGVAASAETVHQGAVVQTAAAPWSSRHCSPISLTSIACNCLEHIVSHPARHLLKSRNGYAQKYR